MDSFVLPCMPECGKYMCRVFISGESRVHGRFYGLDLKKGNGRLGTLHRYTGTVKMIKKMSAG